MRITLNIDESSVIFFYLQDMWEKSSSNSKETFKDYLKDYIMEAAFNSDNMVDEASNYVSENIGSIIAKHPEAAFILMDYLEEEEEEECVIID